MESQNVNDFQNIKLEKLKSKTYRLSWKNKKSESVEIFYTSKAQIVKVVNHYKTYKEIKEFLKTHLISGEVIK